MNIRKTKILKHLTVGGFLLGHFPGAITSSMAAVPGFVVPTWIDGIPGGREGILRWTEEDVRRVIPSKTVPGILHKTS
ncbi:MAG: hypothetical protein LBD60_01245 [Puniceicoccales bacterium]|jgi:hypothetical protein|nr:hypothetical protein [Puniceicoccales bacterium]